MYCFVSNCSSEKVKLIIPHPSQQESTKGLDNQHRHSSRSDNLSSSTIVVSPLTCVRRPSAMVHTFSDASLEPVMTCRLSLLTSKHRITSLWLMVFFVLSLLSVHTYSLRNETPLECKCIQQNKGCFYLYLLLLPFTALLLLNAS